MGQKVGKAKFDERAKPFANLPVQAIRVLWQEFNLCADSWAITPVFWKQLCKVMAEAMEDDFNEAAAAAVFAVFDTDRNDLVDGLELISTLGMLSGMTREEKVNFVFACYDVGRRAALTVNELVLLLKSTCTGLCKLSGFDAPDSARLESTASLILMHAQGDGDGALSLESLSSYCEINPVACSWLAFYDDCSEEGSGEALTMGAGRSSTELETAAPDIFHEEAFFRRRTQLQGRANSGADDGTPTLATVPKGPWVDAAKMMAPPKLVPKEDEQADQDAPHENEESAAGDGESSLSPGPSPVPLPAPPAPDTQLSLEWVYGYSAGVSRSSVRYCIGNSAGGEGVVYPAGKVAVVLSQQVDEEGAEMEDDRIQSFMQEHTDEVMALAVSPCGKWAATGEPGDDPKVIIWNLATKEIRGTLAGFHRMGIICIAWSPCGDLLATVGADEFHSLQIVEIASTKPVFRTRTGRSRPLGMAWTSDGKCLVTCGQTHKSAPPLVFWVKDESTQSFIKKRGIVRGGKLAPSAELQLCVCAAPKQSLEPCSADTPASLVSGTLGGGLCLWRGRNCCKAIVSAHVGAVETVAAVESRGGIVASGGRDAKVKLWSGHDLNQLATLDLLGAPSAAGMRQVRSVCLAADGTKVLVGTLGSEIFELAAVEKPNNSEEEDVEGGEETAPADTLGGDADDGNQTAGSLKRSGIGRVLNGGVPLACGHCDWQTSGGSHAQLRGMDVSIQGDQFVTVGDDGTVRVWSIGEKKALRTHSVGIPVLSIAYSTDASLIAVGLQTGKICILKPSDDDPFSLSLEKNLDAFEETAGGATCVRFSPSGGLLSAGSGDGSLQSWGTSERNWVKTGSAQNLISGAIVNMDFTIDGVFVMMNSTGMEMVVANSESCRKASAEDMNILGGQGEDTEIVAWATSTCTMTDGKQAAWASMTGEAPETGSHPNDTISPGSNVLTGSDLLKGSETPILLASDALGRVGLLRYPAKLPDELTPVEGVASVGRGAEANTPALGEAEIATAKAIKIAEAEAMDAAISAAIPRVSIMKVHAGRIAATRQVGEGGQILTVGAIDRCIYQWAVDLDDGEESGEDLPDPPACNAPAPKGSKEENEDGEAEDDGDVDDVGNATAVSWSGDDEDLLDAAGKPHGGFNNGSQDLSNFLIARASAEARMPPILPWVQPTNGKIAGIRSPSDSPCVPDEGVELEWIHGYSAQGSRQNLFYNCNGEIVYPAACAGVVITKSTPPQPHRQSFNLGHTQAITCLAIHPDKAHVATSQQGSSPFVLVWNSAVQPIKTRATLQLGEDKISASQVCFSADGKLLAVACEDKNHTVMVFRWEAGLLRCQAQAGAKKALSLCFSLKANELLAAGHKHFKVWTLTGGGLMRGKRGLFGSGAKVQALMCTAAVSNGDGGSSFLLGGCSGSILKLEGRKVSTTTEAHEGVLYAMYAYAATDGSGTHLVTGGNDGKVKMWDAELEMINEFDLAGRPHLWGGSPCVRSVCLNDHSDGRKILIGTSCSEIIEISASDGTDVNGQECLVRGHFRDQLWGLAAHPAKALYCSTGDDGILREWDASMFGLKRQIDLEGWVRSVTYSPNGLLVACGMGGDGDTASSSGGAVCKRRSPRDEDGTIKIISGMEDTFRVVNMLSHAAGPIGCIRFSPDGNRMVAGSLDGNAYIYSVLENFKLECIGEGGQGGILRLDFSSDGKWIRSEAKVKGDANAIAVVLFSAETGHVCEDRQIVDEVEGFATWSGLCGDPTTGIWVADATCPFDINLCCRSFEGRLLATADARGDIKLLRYPAAGRLAASKTARAHAPDARSVCFVGKGGTSQYLVSVGGRDRCVIQWRLVKPHPMAITAQEASRASLPEQDLWVQAELTSLEAQKQCVESTEHHFWRSGPRLAGLPPTSNSSPPPGLSLELEFAHGYNASGQARNNLGFSSTDKLILSCASVGIVYDKASQTQVLFTEHTTRVVSLAVSPCGQFVATGQEGSEASAIVWDPATGQTLCRLPSSLSGAVRRLAFSPDGTSLCGIGADANSSLCVWTTASGRWVDGARVSLAEGPRRPALFVTWTGTNDSPYQIMTGGQNFVIFWSLRPNLSLHFGKKPLAGEAGPEKACPSSPLEDPMLETFLCATTLGKAGSSMVVVGTASGAFTVWENFECVKMLRGAHDNSAVLSMAPTQSGGLASGGADGVVKVWDNDLTVKSFHSTPSKGNALCDAIRAVTVNRKESNMAIGTSSGRVIEISLDSGEASILVDGPAAAIPRPSTGDTCSTTPSDGVALARSPTEANIFVTGASDGVMRKWSANESRLLAKVEVGSSHSGHAPRTASEGGDMEPLLGIGAMDWASGGDFVACGLSSGDVVIVSPGDMTVLSRCPSNKKPNSAVTALVICPGGTSVVVGCWDGSTHGMKVSPGGMGVEHLWSNPTGAANASIVAINVSMDGQTIRCCDAAGILSFISASGTSLNTPPPGDSDPVTWASSRCFFGQWDVRAASTSLKSKGDNPLLAAKAEGNILRLWRYPAAQEEAMYITGDAVHFGSPAAFAFTGDEMKVLSVGGVDSSILQWSVIRKFDTT